MEILTDTILIQAAEVRSLRSETIRNMVNSEDASYGRVRNDVEAFHYFNLALQRNHDCNPYPFTPSRNNPHFTRGGKRRGSKSPSKSARKAAAKTAKQEEKGAAKSPKKDVSSSSSCGPDYNFPHAKDEDPPSYL